MSHSPLKPLTVLLVLGLGFFLAGCGGGGGEYYVEEVIVVPLADVEVDNQTDLSGTFEDLFYFDMALAGTEAWTDNLLPDIVLPGEILYVDSIFEDVYDAGAELDLGFVEFFDIFVEAGFTTTFEVF